MSLKVTVADQGQKNAPLTSIEIYPVTLPIERAKELLESNQTNRPKTKGNIKRYKRKMIDHMWWFNTDCLEVDSDGHVVSGQHRLIAYVEAMDKYTEAVEAEDIDETDEFPNGPPLFPCVVAVGTDPRSADSRDIGKPRNGGDVFYRNGEFSEFEKDSTRKKLCKALSAAVRLIWIRSRGGLVKDAPKFEIEDQVRFLEEHPRIREMVSHVVEEDGTGQDGKQISSLVSLGYMAGFAYLLATSKTERTSITDYDVNYDLWDSATDFVGMFANGLFSKEQVNSPIKRLRDYWTKLEGSKDRDLHVSGPLVKSMQMYADGEECKSVGAIKCTSGDDPRLGGLDVSPEMFNPDLNTSGDDAEKSAKPSKPPKKRASKGYTAEPAKPKAAKKKAAKKKAAKKKAVPAETTE